MRYLNDEIFEDLMDRFKWYPKPFTVNIFCKVSDEKYITVIDNLYTMLKAKTDLKHIITYLETEKAKENRYEAFC